MGVFETRVFEGGEFICCCFFCCEGGRIHGGGLFPTWLHILRLAYKNRGLNIGRTEKKKKKKKVVNERVYSRDCNRRGVELNIIIVVALLNDRVIGVY